MASQISTLNGHILVAKMICGGDDPSFPVFFFSENEV
jgi:hypothetical protein